MTELRDQISDRLHMALPNGVRCAPLADALMPIIATALAAEREKARAPFLALHRPDPDSDAEDIGGLICDHCRYMWPCATIRAAEADGR